MLSLAILAYRHLGLVTLQNVLIGIPKALSIHPELLPFVDVVPTRLPSVANIIGLIFFCFFGLRPFQLCCNAFEKGMNDCDFLTVVLTGSVDEEASAGRLSFAFSVFSL